MAATTTLIKGLLITGLTSGCDLGAFGPNPSRLDATASPTASVNPEPLDDPRPDRRPTVPTAASAAPSAVSTETREPSAPPEPLNADGALARDRRPGRPPDGVDLEVTLRWAPLTAPPSAPEVDVETLERLRAQDQPKLLVTLTESGRMSLSISSGFVLEPNTRLVARRDRYGYALVWPRDLRYRVVAPGALRPLLGEGRLDVIQLATGVTETLPPDTRAGRPVVRYRIRTPVAEAEIALAEVPGAGAGAGLFCRLVVELAGATPSLPVCSDARVLVAAELRWRADRERLGGDLRFDVTAIEPREKIRFGGYAMPPVPARLTTGRPPRRTGPWVETGVLNQLRTAPRTPPESAPTLEPVFSATNASDHMLTLFVDGIAVGLVAPWQTLRIDGLPTGEYTVAWRSFLGDAPPVVASRWLPATVVYGRPTPAAEGRPSAPAAAP
ncbi:MAG: hypothetical protein AAF715_27720 [Myxococcota bacterium]